MTDRPELLADDLRRLAGLAEAGVGEASKSPTTSCPVWRPGVAGAGRCESRSATTANPRRARKGARGGRSPAFDRERYRQRNQVERLMNRRRQFRVVATCFDKLAVRYQATVCVADIFIWLRARPGRTR
jgi:transposase